jgi:hypothetical protein
MALQCFFEWFLVKMRGVFAVGTGPDIHYHSDILLLDEFQKSGEKVVAVANGEDFSGHLRSFKGFFSS